MNNATYLTPVAGLSEFRSALKSGAFAAQAWDMSADSLPDADFDSMPELFGGVRLR